MWKFGWFRLVCFDNNLHRVGVQACAQPFFNFGLLGAREAFFGADVEDVDGGVL